MANTIIIAGGVASLSFAFVDCGGGAECWSSTDGPVTSYVILAVSGVIGAVALFVLHQGSNTRLAEGREKVREAERDLERALRLRLDRFPLPEVSGEIIVEPGRRLALSELWAVTHRRLDLYHEIATGQASRSFRNAQIAMVLGFVLLVAFVIVALQASTTAGAVVAGGLGAVAAALAGYVSRTFVRSQEAAANHLRAYFDQPLEFSRYLAAERLVAESNLTEEQRAEVVTELAKAMIAGPTPPAGDTANGSSGEARNPRA
ncbi:hypothetical protein ACFRAO_07535 [Streptomyces sp. NPDC056656]|uniref:hypothetical protein n=1 Tax=Streptomyces sp. NPDC056656 TaxID=3345895 RepID=UPI0036C2B16E